MQFHILSLEGPDAYARAGGLASRVEGLAGSLSSLGFETHLWFVGDPGLPGHEHQGRLRLHRWCQWISRHHPGGVYDGEFAKLHDYAGSVPPFLFEQTLLPHLGAGGRAVVMAEEWHTVGAVFHLDEILRHAGLRDRVSLLWNANNNFGFDQIDWRRLASSATLTTVSRYMKHKMHGLGVDPIVIHNGLTEDAFDPPSAEGAAELRRRFPDRTVLVKMARFDPDKRWLMAIEIVRQLKERGWRPLLVARGGSEAHGSEVYHHAHRAGLRIADRAAKGPGVGAMLSALEDVGEVDLVSLQSFVDPDARRLLFHGAHAVLANSGHEPFGLVGLETMAAGGLACTGYSGEDYVVPGRNALVLQTADAREFVDLYGQLRSSPEHELAMRNAGRSTAREYAWPEVIQRSLLPRVEILTHP